MASPKPLTSPLQAKKGQGAPDGGKYKWLYLWYDMHHDPRWRAIARTSGEPLSLVVSVAFDLLADVAPNLTHVTITAEDVASVVTDDAVEAVLKAMQSRVLDNDTKVVE